MENSDLLCQKKHFLGYFDGKEAVIMAGIEAEKKCFDPAFEGSKGI